jgi:hypothetical protein
VALAIFGGAVLTVAVSMALGALLLGACARDWALRFVAGSAVLSMAVFGLCAAGLAYPWVFAAVGAGAIGFAAMAGTLRASGQTKTPVLPKIVYASVPYIVLTFSNAMAPEISFDGSRYHLALVGRYLREHGFHAITDNMYALLSQGIEMLYLYAYAFGRHSAASLVHFAFFVALGWLMFQYAKRAGFPVAGTCGALLVIASPVVDVTAASAYIDVAVAAIAFALFYLLQIWDDTRAPRLLIAIGLLAGFAFGAKYTAFAAIPYALGFVGWKSRRPRDLVVVAGCAALMIAPWMARNWIWTHNPLAPFFNGVFPNPYFTVAFEREYRQHMALYNLASRWEIPIEVTTRGSLSGLLGPVFLLSPIALLSLRRREGRQLLLAAAVFGGAYFSNIGTRFLIPALPFVALAMMLALNSVPRVALALVLVHAVISWPSVVRRYCAPDAWHLVKVPYREALRIKPEDGFLASNLPLYRVTRMVEESAAPGSTVLSLTSIPEAYTSRKILVPYESASNAVSRMILLSGFVPEHAPTWRLRFGFARRPLRAIRILQTNTGKDTWSIHELRLFDGARELPRTARWRWTAEPYPWGIENIHDGRPLTFWTCGDTLHPDQLVQVDFGGSESADAVMIEAAPNQYQVQLKLEGRDQSGLWTLLAAKPEASDVLVLPGLRRAASEELKRRGVDYVLVFDGEFGAADLRDNAALWGIGLAGQAEGARLYRLP